MHLERFIMKKLVLYFIATLIFTSTGSLLAQDFDKGLAAYKAGDYATALKEFKPLAEQGHARAQASLGGMYAMGLGVPQDTKAAMKLYILVAEQGHARAQSSLGVIYAVGLGVPKDYKAAVKWFRLAAEQGDATAQFNLGSMYIKGQSVPQDNIIAYMWLNLADTNGYKDASKYRDIVVKIMSQADISKAQAMSSACFAQDYNNCGY